MQKGKIYEDLSPLERRSGVFFILVKILIVFLVIYFWKIQIIDHRKYLKRSEANILREVTIPSPRGLIKDRSGNTILADNDASFKVSIIRENCRNFDLSCMRIARLLGLSEEVLKERIARYSSLPYFKPIVVKDNLSIEEVSMIESRKREFPELILQSEPKRIYPFASFAAHTLGYLGEISEEELRSNIYRERRPGELVGKRGIERVYDDMLRGREGQLIEIVDSRGKVRGEARRRKPVQGYSLKLTLDFDLQKKAEELLRGKEGAAVVLDPRNGEVLALASYPTFDLNKFIERFPPQEWQQIKDDPDFPLENRAIRGLYAPGSVFKPVIAIAALDSGLISERTAFTCRGKVYFYGQPFSCWREEGHGVIKLEKAIQHSCNIYFYHLGKMLGIREIARYAGMLGFGEKTGIDLPGEKSGLVPRPEWKLKTKNIPWFPGETISVSIGQGPILVTPLQVAVYTATIANRGRKIVPHLLYSYTEPKSGKETMLFSSREGEKVGIESSVFDKVISGMWRAVNREGTARATMIRGFDVCGKTGSVQLKSSKNTESEVEVKTHSWFTGFAPAKNPQVVVTLIVEYGGMGGETAAPMARELFRLYRKKYD
ncbi:MAG: penicillin-binding protein 2 [Candidatus Aminicenantales bacterium]